MVSVFSVNGNTRRSPGVVGIISVYLPSFRLYEEMSY